MIILTATAQAESKVALSWASVPTGTQFIRVFRAKVGEGQTLVASIAASETSYTDTATVNVEFQYEVEFVLASSSEFSTVATVKTKIL
jgi:fibronectin type 3 domain-containing protein